MRRFDRRSATRCAVQGLATVAVLMGLAFPCVAQSADESTATGNQKESGEAQTGDSPRLAAKDYGRFESLSRATISADGEWVSYSIRRMDGTYELHLRELSEDEPEVYECGGRPTFSPDTNWFAFSIGVPPAEREKMEKKKQPVKNKLGLLDLSSGEKTEIDDIQSFSFSADGRALVMRSYGERGAQGGGDIVVRDLATSSDMHFGGVTEDRWSDVGNWLAMCIEAPGGKGNAVRLYEVDGGTIRVLDSSSKKYRGLSWREDAADLAVYREHDHEKEEDATHDVLAWRGVNDRGATMEAFEHLDRDGFSEDYFVPRDRRISWSADGTTMFFGIREWDNKPAALADDEETDDDGDGDDDGGDDDDGEDDDGEDGDADDDSETDADEAPESKDGETEDSDTEDSDSEETESDEAIEEDASPDEKEDDRKSLRETLSEAPGVEIWHPIDIDIIPLQKRRANFERNRTFLISWCLDCDAFQQLGNELTESVTPLEGGLFAIGTDNTPYENQKRFGPTLVDLYAINHHNGERMLIESRNKYRYGSSPQGRYYLYFQAGNYWVYDTWAGQSRNLTGPLSESFVNQEVSTLTDEKPPYGVGGWSADDSFFVIYDEFDVWKIESDGSSAERLTNGYEEQVRYRRSRVEPDDETDFAPERPMYLSLYGEKTKQTGLARYSWEEESTTRLRMGDANYSRLSRAENASVFVYRRESFADSPDVFVTDESFEDSEQVSSTNSFQDEYFTSRAELVQYKSRRGDSLQGVLYYPSDYDPSRRYPMIVYIYEELSQNMHRYVTPSERSAYNTRVFTTSGYFVLHPDIVYQPQNPGVSAVECVEPAVEAVLAKRVVDGDRVGLVGHSWGAYQTAFIVTQSKLFAAGVAGAPLTNMMSMSTGVYWNSGQTNAWIFHESQGRMDRPFWRDVETYIRNSPIFHLDTLAAPLLIAFGNQDGAVDWHQGVEMYNAARLAQKPVVMLVYEGENHGLRKKPNQVDYHYRVRDWFDHHLKGVDAPDWILEGESFLEREEINREIEKGDKKKPSRKKGSRIGS